MLTIGILHLTTDHHISNMIFVEDIIIISGSSEVVVAQDVILCVIESTIGEDHLRIRIDLLRIPIEI